MRVMYWNCTAPGSGNNSFNQDKLDFIQQVVTAVDPDILCLDEVSQSVGDINSAKSFANEYLNKNLKFTEPKVSVNPGYHLNSVTYSKSDVTGVNKGVGVPNKNWSSNKTKRDLTRCKFNLKQKDVYLFFLHANASPSGGKHAVELASDDIGDNEYWIFMGDFNYPIGKAANAVTPKVGVSGFTQWNRNDYGSVTVPNSMPPVKFTPHDIIDYAICDSNEVSLTPVDTLNNFSDDDKRKMIVYFDHFPIAYDIDVL